MVAKDDRTINRTSSACTRRAHSHTQEVSGSHSIFIAHAGEAAAMIEDAARTAGQ